MMNGHHKMTCAAVIQMATLGGRIESLTLHRKSFSTLVGKTFGRSVNQSLTFFMSTRRLLSTDRQIIRNAQPVKSRHQETIETTHHQADGTVIVGGGLAGLATALALRSISGASNVHVFESLSKEEFCLENAGAAVQVGPNGLRALREIGGDGLMNRVIEAGSVIKKNITTVQTQSGSSNVSQNAMDNGLDLPVILIRWGVLRSMLANQLPSDCLNTGFGDEIIGYGSRHFDEASVVFPVDIEGQVICDLQGTPRYAPLLVGADGLYSIFRYCLHNNVCLPVEVSKNIARAEMVDMGRVNVKAVAPVDLSEEESCEPNTTYSFITKCGQVAYFAGPAGSRYTYWSISIADQDGERFLSSNPENLDLVKENVMSLLRRLDSPGRELVLELVANSDADAIVVRRSEEVPMDRLRLISDDGRVVLVGDACSVTNAAYGHAASFAFEDAATLAVSVRDSQDIPTALQEYSKLRLDRRLEMQQRCSAERALKAMRGESTNDVSKWIFEWDI